MNNDVIENVFNFIILFKSLKCYLLLYFGYIVNIRYKLYLLKSFLCFMNLVKFLDCLFNFNEIYFCVLGYREIYLL